MKRLTIVTMQLRTPGGIERLISTLATMFSSNFAVEIIVNYGRPTDPLAFPLPGNVKLTFLTPSQPRAVSLKNLLLHPKSWSKIPPELRRRRNITKTQHKVFHKVFHNLNTDIIITDRALYNSLVAKHYHGPATKITTDHNFHQHNRKYISTLLSSIKSFDYLVVATDELRDFYAPRTKIKCLTIPNPLPVIPAQRSPLTTKNLLSVGRLVPEKDFPLLLRSMSQVVAKDPSIHLTIIGDGAERPSLEAYINSRHLKSNITLTGWLSASEIAKHYLASSLYISTSKTEAFGLTLAEAMSYGLPCLALSRASGARAQITKNRGILLSSTSPTAIANQILNLMSDLPALRSYQPRLTKYVSTLTPDSVLSAWLNILK